MPLLAWDSFPLASGERLIAAPVNQRRGKAAGEPTVYDFLQRMEKERSRNEEPRALRRRHACGAPLHLVGVARRDEEGALRRAARRFAAARLWPAVEAEFVRAAAGADEGQTEVCPAACPTGRPRGVRAAIAALARAGRDAGLART